MGCARADGGVSDSDGVGSDDGNGAGVDDGEAVAFDDGSDDRSDVGTDDGDGDWEKGRRATIRRHACTK